MDLTTIIQRYRQTFVDKYSLSHDQRHALDATLNCHTERYGEMQLRCNHCDIQKVHYHSCGHRSCHRCQNHDTTRWLERQSQKLLPVEYFMVTFTMPFELRTLTRKNQKVIYAILFQCASSTLKDFALKDQKLGSDIGMTAVLHTHSRQLNYHPHIHVIVPGGTLSKVKRQWKKQRGTYLFHAFSLANVFRARVLQAIRESGLVIPQDLPKKWVIDCTHVGKGFPALKYLSRYLYRGVISENNIIADDGKQVTFRYTDNQGLNKTQTLLGEDFLWLLFQHVLPKGFRRVRDYGFLHANAKKTLKLIQQILCVFLPQVTPSKRPAHLCSVCKNPMVITAFIPASWRSG